MRWDNCFTSIRIGDSKNRADIRSQYTRDYDKIIFSSPFRRLQNKTQVFPLPGTSFVHNRHTHSLEVASVGRSLASIVGDFIAEEKIKDKDHPAYSFYKYELPAVISSACLAHDIGNPAFGHSGEDAISEFFKLHASLKIDGEELGSYMAPEEWNDLINFEGNANAFRILTRVFDGKSPYGMGITLSTLVSMMKYPCNSNQVNKQYKHRKKYGYFQSDAKGFQFLAEHTNMIPDVNEDGVYLRHPFVYLVEAADDICYNIIDMEDAHRLGILGTQQVSEAFLHIIEDIDGNESSLVRTKDIFSKIGDANESIAFLRSVLINVLVTAASQQFIENHEAILEGRFNESLVGVLEGRSPGLKDLIKMSVERIYQYSSVIEVELAGFHVMSELLNIYVPSALKAKRSTLDKSVLSMMPTQFKGDINNASHYLRVMNVIDHISSMTDAYATEHYRRLRGIEIRNHD